MAQPTEPTGPQQPPEPQICCDCGFITREPIEIGEAWAAGGAGRTVYACPEHAPRYPVGDAS